MLNIVIINNNSGIRTTKLHFYKIFEYLAKMPNFKTIEFAEIVGTTETQMADYFVNKFGKIPNNIIFFEHLTEMNKINVPKESKINVILDDLHHQGATKTNRIHGLEKVSRILSTYGYCFAKYYSSKVPVYFFPHSAAFDISFNDNPINKILISGRLNKGIYPFRNLIHQISKENKFLEYMPVNCNYEIYQDSENLIYGQRYVNELNKYLVCFTCDASADRPYIVAKHFEIMSSGSLLFAGNPNTKKYFEKMGFVDGIHYVSVTMENIYDKINYIMDPSNRNMIDNIRKTGYNFVRSHHFYKNRAEYLKNILEENNDIYIHTDGICNTNYYLEKSYNVNNKQY